MAVPAPSDAVPDWTRGTLAGPGTGVAVRTRGADPGPRVALVADAADPLASAALAALALELDPDALAGTCTLVPGCALGHAAALDALEAHLLPETDLVLELGAGDPTMRWSPTAIVRLAAGARIGARGDPLAETAMVAFGAPESLRLHAPEADARPDRAAARTGRPGRPPVASDGVDIDLGAPETPEDASEGAPAGLAGRAARRGVAHVEVRSGGAGPDRLELLIAGCRNVLVSVGALAAPLELRATRHLTLGPPPARPDGAREGGGAGREIGTTVRATARGTLEMALAPGADVHAGAVLARLADPERPDERPVELLAPRDGTLLACRVDGAVAPGDPVALIAEEVPP